MCNWPEGRLRSLHLRGAKRHLMHCLVLFVFVRLKATWSFCEVKREVLAWRKYHELSVNHFAFSQNIPFFILKFSTWTLVTCLSLPAAAVGSGKGSGSWLGLSQESPMLEEAHAENPAATQFYKCLGKGDLISLFPKELSLQCVCLCRHSSTSKRNWKEKR